MEENKKVIFDRHGKIFHEGDFVRIVKDYSFGDDYHGEPVDIDRTDTIEGRIHLTWYSGIQISGRKKSWNDIDGEEIHGWQKYKGRPSEFYKYAEIVKPTF